MFRASFWKQSAERAAKTAAQAGVMAFVGTDPGNQVGFNAFAADWTAVLSFMLGGALLSLLTSVASSNVGPGESPSMVETRGPDALGRDAG